MGKTIKLKIDTHQRTNIDEKGVHSTGEKMYMFAIVNGDMVYTRPWFCATEEEIKIKIDEQRADFSDATLEVIYKDK